MLIRNSSTPLDELFCAAQGYVAATIVNAVHGARIASPFNAALCFGGIAYTEKLFYRVSKEVIPGYTGFIGPFPAGSKNVVSYAAATYTTLKVMELAGLILSVPPLVKIAGLLSLVAFVAGGVLKALEKFQLKLEDHLKSEKFGNQVFTIDYQGKEYKVRIICNPKREKVTVSPGGMGKVSSHDDFIIACNTNLPKDFVQDTMKIPQGKTFSTFTANINHSLPLDYMASPVVGEG